MKTRILLSIGLLLVICNSHVQAAPECKVLNPSYDGSYSGGCKDGLANGEGIAAKGGVEYRGMFVDGKRHGKGTVTSQSGEKYEGDFADDKLQGRGTYTWQNGDKYEGDWVGGKPHGKGTNTMQNGNKYEGDFVDGKRHGKGTVTLANGTTQSGDWVDDKLVASSASANNSNNANTSASDSERKQTVINDDCKSKIVHYKQGMAERDSFVEFVNCKVSSIVKGDLDPLFQVSHNFKADENKFDNYVFNNSAVNKRSREERDVTTNKLCAQILTEFAPIAKHFDNISVDGCYVWINNNYAHLQPTVAATSRYFKVAEEIKLEQERLAKQQREKLENEQRARAAAQEAARQAEIEKHRKFLTTPEGKKWQAEQERQERQARANLAKQFPYYAIISCGMNGWENMNVLACFSGSHGVDTEIELTNGNDYGMYKAYNIANGQIGQQTREGLVINLRNHHSLKVQNSQDTLLLGVRIIERMSGKIMFQKQVGHYGIIKVRD